MSKLNIRTRLTAMRDKLAYTPCEIIDIEPGPIRTNKTDLDKFAKMYLKVALGEAYKHNPEAALEVLDILKQEKYI